MVSATAPARVGLLGNPSDGYGGRTIGLAVPRWQAEVSVEPADRLEIVELEADRPHWASVGELVDRVDHHGYGTGPQLLAATIRTLSDLARSVDHHGFDRLRCRVRYHTTIPRSVGLAGSSALVVAALRAFTDAIALDVPPEVLATVALRVETEQLGITAGLQDRVVQSFGGLVAMDFGSEEVDGRFGVSHGTYRSLDPAALPPLFLAYRQQAAEPSDGYHRRLRRRFDEGDRQVRDVMHRLAALAVEGEAALRWGNADRFGQLMAENMNLRRQLGPLPDSQLALIDAAASCDAPATFAGSGGAVVGAFEGDDHFATLAGLFGALDAEVVRLAPVPPAPDSPEEASDFEDPEGTAS